MTAAVEAAPARHDGWWRQLRTDRSAWALLALLVVAVPVLLHAGRAQWFWADEWDFIDERSLTDPASLLRPWWGHAVVLPAAAYRVVVGIWGIGSYRPFLLLSIAGHLGVVVVVWIAARRLGVRGWIATASVVPLLLLGSGRQNIFWGFQITLTASLAFGLAHLLLADHGGQGWTRRDSAGVACGLAALLCSGVALATTVGVGVSVLLRRGRRPAVLHSVPLALGFLAWSSGFTDPNQATDPSLGTESFEYAARVLLASFDALGQVSLAAGLVAVVAAVGLFPALVALRRRSPDTSTLVVGIAASLVAFAAAVAVQRTEHIDDGTSLVASRYVHVSTALVLPLVALGIERAARRNTVLAVAALGVLAVGLPGNLRQLDDRTDFEATLDAVFLSEHLDDAPADHPVLFLDVQRVRDLRDARLAEGIGPVEPVLQLTADALLTMEMGLTAAPPDCPAVSRLRRQLGAGDAVEVAGDVDVVVIDGDRRSLPLRYRNVAGGRELRARVPMLLDVQGRFGGVVFDC